LPALLRKQCSNKDLRIPLREIAARVESE